MSSRTPAISLKTSDSDEQRTLSMWQDTLSRLLRSPSARFGGFITISFIIISILVPLLDNYNASRDSNLSARYNEPDCIIGFINGSMDGDFLCEFPFGADENGRNIFRRVGHGMSVSLVAGVFSVAIAVSIGTTIGLASGYLSGWVDSTAMRIMDVVLAFPSLLLAITLVTVAGPGLRNGMIAVAVTQIPVYARLARSMAISVRNMEYVMAARSVGASDFTIIRKHIFPNSLAPIIVQSTLGLGTAVVETAALGYLGLGQQPPFPELGKMLADSQSSLASGKWWVMLFPAVTIILMVLGFNLLGDGLRDALDPRLRGND